MLLLHKISDIFPVLVIFFTLLAGCQSPPDTAEFSAGMRKDTLVTQFGEPLQRQELVKTKTHIWGAIEELWYQLPDGTLIEVWIYKVQGGTVELYFLNKEDVVYSTEFSPEGVVY